MFLHEFTTFMPITSPIAGNHAFTMACYEDSLRRIPGSGEHPIFDR
jgi:hypothetical protein